MLFAACMAIIILPAHRAIQASSPKAAFVSLSNWGSVLNRPVNKRFLSTGETGELVRVNVGFDSNPGVVCATPQDLASHWREGAARKNLRNVEDTGGMSKGAAVNKTCPRSWGGEIVPPRKTWYQTTSPTCNSLNLCTKSEGFTRVSVILTRFARTSPDSVEIPYAVSFICVRSWQDSPKDAQKSDWLAHRRVAVGC